MNLLTGTGSKLAGRHDWSHPAMVAAVFAAGALLRFYHIHHSGLSMWDEWEFVRCGRWLSTLGQDGGPHGPDVAPPLFASWLAMGFLVAGFHDYVAVGASAVMSLATLVVLYLLGRFLYGTAAALVATAFLAGNLYNLIFAHQAITDATFQCFFVLAVLALVNWIRQGRGIAWLLAGVSLGLCQNVKYHGLFAWFPVAAWAALCASRGTLDWRTVIRRLLAAAGLALVLVLPWVLIVAHRYGLRALLRHYLAYSVATGGNRGTLLHLWTYLTLWCSPWFLVMAGLGALVAAWRRHEADMLLLVWVALFVAGSCVYQAYPRLALPLTSAMALLAGRGTGWLVEGHGRRWALALACAIAVTTGTVHAWSRMGPYGSAYRAAGRYLTHEIPAGSLVTGVTQPVLWHYCGKVLQMPAEPNVRQALGRGEPVYVVTDLVLHWKTPSRALIERNARRALPTWSVGNDLSEPDILTTLGLEEFAAYRNAPDDPRWDSLRQIRVSRVTEPWNVGADVDSK